MADAIELYLNIGTPRGSLVQSLTETGSVQLGPFYQGQLLPLRIYPVVPTYSQTGAAYSKVDLTNLDIQVVVGPSAGSEAIKAAQYTWSKQTSVDSEGKSGYFYANLDLNTSAMNTAVGSLEYYDTKFEVLLARGAAAAAQVFQTPVQILSVVKDPGSAATIPTPTPSYLTADQCYNLFVMWNNSLRSANAGRNVIFVSPDSSKQREIGVDDDGNPIDYTI